MPALSAFADLLDKAADLLMDPAITYDELCKRGFPGQGADEKKLLTRLRDQTAKALPKLAYLRDSERNMWGDLHLTLRFLSEMLPGGAGYSRDVWVSHANNLRMRAEHFRGLAAQRRQEAKELRRLRKRAGDPKGGEATEAVPERLTDAQQQAFDLIKNKGPLTGKEIVVRLGLSSESNFTTHYVPALKAHGVKNRRGLGYYLP